MMTLTDIWQTVWAFRAEANSWWPTPDVRTSLLYAFTEIAEAVDAQIRSEHPDHARNSARNLNVEEELADCVIMLLTALRDTGANRGLLNLSPPLAFREYDMMSIAYNITRAALGLPVGASRWIHAAIWYCIGKFDSIEDCGTMVQLRLERIRAKHGPKEE